MLAAAALAALALGACGKDDEPEDKRAATTGTAPTTATTTAATTATTPLTASGCQMVEAPKPTGEQDRPRPVVKLDRRKTYTATLDTNCGKIAIRLDVKRSPKTAASFFTLVRSGFYNGLTFHRIARPAGNDFVIQGGDPLGTGSGGPGYTIVERPRRNARYTRGVVAMAKTEIEDAGTSGSQFFIVTAPDAGLPADYAIVGRVVGSRKAVARIAKVPAEPETDRPVDPIVIRKATIDVS